VPLLTESATFSANSRHTVQRMNSASPSSHAFVCRLKLRGVEATVKLHTRHGLGVSQVGVCGQIANNRYGGFASHSLISLPFVQAATSRRSTLVRSTESCRDS